MCGIAGITGYEPGFDPLPHLQKMVAGLRHRGPDAEGTWVGEGIALGHTRLAILDLSDAGRQPMHSPDGRFTIVFNGEIYNFREIRAELHNVEFHTETDTEVILAGFARWGAGLAPKLNGMFAMAIADNQKGTVTLFRDRLGIKPLYYHQDGKILRFGSEIRALLQSGIRKRLNYSQLGDFLRYQTVAAPNTLAEGVKLLPPGTVAVFENGKLSIQRFWEAATAASEEARGMEGMALKARVRDLLRASVERRMIADVPLGAFLSGGIDSSAVVGLMSEVSEQSVDTFSVVFREKDFDESEWSEMVAKKFHTRHHPILLKPNDFLDALPNALAAMDHPSADGVNSYVVSGVTRKQGITVALSGLGGDELFAGYPFFRQLLELQQRKILQITPYFLRKGIAGLATIFPGGRRGQKISDVLRTRDTSLQSVFPVYRRLFSGSLADLLLPPEKQGENAVEKWLDTYAGDLEKLPVLSQISAAEMENYMQHILLRDTDQMSMAHALEVRVPFLDHELVEFVLGVPDSRKFPGYPKQLLVESLGDLLPEAVVHRKKMGFTFPWDHWMRNELFNFCGERLEYLESRSVFRPGSIKELWNRFEKEDNTVIWAHVWLLVVLADWMQRNGIEE